jgi:hypothetical protein
MSRFIGFCIFLAVILYGWQALSGTYEAAYNQKVVLSAYSVLGNGTDEEALSGIGLTDSKYEKAQLVTVIETLSPSLSVLSAGERRTVALALGETDLRYHLKLNTGNYVPTTFDFSTNLLYNVSYLANTPSKLLHNIKMDFALAREMSDSGPIGRGIGFGVKVIFVIWDILHAVTGAAAALVMLVFGSLIGLLFHPINSVINFFPMLWNVCVTIWHAIRYIFNLF